MRVYVDHALPDPSYRDADERMFRDLFRFPTSYSRRCNRPITD